MAKFYKKHKNRIILCSVIFFIVLLILPISITKRLDINGEYVSKEDVALYLITYHELPKNYITKGGRDYAKNHNIDISDKLIGGDTFINTGELKDYNISEKIALKECDIKNASYTQTNRGTHRLLYTCNVKNFRVFYTESHYEENSFTEIKIFDLQIGRNICWIIFGIYSVGIVIFFVVCEKKFGKSANNELVVSE